MASTITANTMPNGETEATPGAGNQSAVNVVALAEDATLLELLRQALGARKRVWRADDALHAADLLLAAQTAVLFVDMAVTKADTPGLVERLSAQFPDLPIVVAGRRDDELALGALISSGAVFRFLHKPVSTERARNFLDAAARRAVPTRPPETRKNRFNPLAAARSLRLPDWRLDPAVAQRAGRALGMLALATGVVWGASEVAQHRPWQHVTLPGIEVADLPAQAGRAPAGDTNAQQQPELARLLVAAGIALTQGRLTEPEGQNAVELYRAVLLRDPGNAQARQGLARTAEELLEQVEQALLAEDLAMAAGALDAARSADPSSPRLGFYSNQLQRERERQQAAAARPTARGPSVDRALAGETGRLLTLADSRMRQGRLAGGADSAEAYVLAARDLQPDDPGVKQALNALSGRLLLAATQALGAGDTDAARNWLDRADALAVDAAAVARLRAEMESARVATVQEDLSRLLALANQRIAQGRLVEPATDSARHYVDLLRAADPGYAGLAETEGLLAARLLEEARRLRDEGRRAEAAEALPENTLERLVHRPATYPPRARERGIEGWVEVEFTVASDGTTRDLVVTGTEPEGVFDDAVREAVAAWRYAPRLVAGRPVEQRVQARIRFELAGG